MTQDHEFTLSSARVAAERGGLSRWVGEYLSSPGSDNQDLAEDLLSRVQWWSGPVVLPFEELHRLAGPPDEPTLARLEEGDVEVVEDMTESLEDGWEPPPLIVVYRNDQLVVEDGNHRLESLRRSGETQGWAIVGCETSAERERCEALDPGTGADAASS